MSRQFATITAPGALSGARTRAAHQAARRMTISALRGVRQRPRLRALTYCGVNKTSSGAAPHSQKRDCSPMRLATQIHYHLHLKSRGIVQSKSSD